MNTVTKHTRAPLKGRTIYCPNCVEPHHVYNFSWSALYCSGCSQPIAKETFLLQHNAMENLMSTPAEYKATLNLTEKQHFFLSEIAQSHYRTFENLLACLVTEGLNYYPHSHEIFVKKREEDKDSENERYYKDEEIVEEFKSLPFQQ